jgi:hypothetical protein
MPIPPNPGLLAEERIARGTLSIPVRSMAWPELLRLRDSAVFFHHFLLLQRSGVADVSTGGFDPLIEWAMRQSAGAVSYGLLPTPVCIGGVDRQAQHTLGIVRRDLWPELRDFLAGTAVVDREQQRYTQTMVGRVLLCPQPDSGVELDLLDPSSIVTVYVFGVDSNQARWVYLQPEPKWLPAPIEPRPPDPRTVALARNVFGGTIEAISEVSLGWHGRRSGNDGDGPTDEQSTGNG